MRARLQKLLDDMAEAFWLLPSFMVLCGVLLAWGLVEVEQGGYVPDAVLSLAYGGSDTGARTLLGAFATSTIAVAGTLFSITIAALTLASSQMGPRLLRNFTRDMGNQVTLGVLLGAFAYSLVLLRTVRGGDEVYVPQVALTVGLGLAFACIGALIYFVDHMANRINVDTVVDLVHRDLANSVDRLTAEAPEPDVEDIPTSGAGWVRESRAGYVQQIDEEGLIGWAKQKGATVRLMVRAGSYVHPGAVVAMVTPTTADAHEAVRDALVLGRRAAGFADIEFGVNQLVEVAVRALSPGINDPLTAIRVLDSLGSVLCVMAERHLPGRTVVCDGRLVLVRDPTTYDGLVDLMLHMIRQNGARQPAVLLHMLQVLTRASLCERNPERLAILRRHGALILEDGRREIANPSDVAELEARHERFAVTATLGEPMI